jgi:hypothetical protein
MLLVSRRAAGYSGRLSPLLKSPPVVVGRPSVDWARHVVPRGGNAIGRWRRWRGRIVVGRRRNNINRRRSVIGWRRIVEFRVRGNAEPETDSDADMRFRFCFARHGDRSRHEYRGGDSAVINMADPTRFERAISAFGRTATFPVGKPQPDRMPFTNAVLIALLSTVSTE